MAHPVVTPEMNEALVKTRMEAMGIDCVPNSGVTPLHYSMMALQIRAGMTAEAMQLQTPLIEAAYVDRRRALGIADNESDDPLDHPQLLEFLTAAVYSALGRPPPQILLLTPIEGVRTIVSSPILPPEDAFKFKIRDIKSDVMVFVRRADAKEVACKPEERHWGDLIHELLLTPEAMAEIDDIATVQMFKTYFPGRRDKIKGLAGFADWRRKSGLPPLLDFYLDMRQRNLPHLEHRDFIDFRAGLGLTDSNRKNLGLSLSGFVRAEVDLTAMISTLYERDARVLLGLAGYPNDGRAIPRFKLLIILRPFLKPPVNLAGVPAITELINEIQLWSAEHTVNSTPPSPREVARHIMKRPDFMLFMADPSVEMKDKVAIGNILVSMVQGRPTVLRERDSPWGN